MHPRHGAARYHDPRIGRGEREQDADNADETNQWIWIGHVAIHWELGAVLYSTVQLLC